MIKQCSCKSEFQDKTYGKQMRVHRIPTKKGEEPRCTVCKPQRLKARLESYARGWVAGHSLPPVKCTVVVKEGRKIINVG